MICEGGISFDYLLHIIYRVLYSVCSHDSCIFYSFSLYIILLATC